MGFGNPDQKKPQRITYSSSQVQLNTPDKSKITRKKSFHIGFNYRNTANELSGCENDINKFSQYLQTQGYTTEKVLGNVSKSQLISRLNKFISSLRVGDVFIFHYSGHGTSVQDQNGDETDNMDEVIVSGDFGYITDDELASIFMKIPDGVRMFALMDCCFSGTILDLPLCKYSNNSFIYESKKKFNADIVCFSGSTDSQYSVEYQMGGKIYGLLTYKFIEVLNANRGNSWNALYNKLLIAIYGADQKPVLSTNVNGVHSLINFI